MYVEQFLKASTTHDMTWSKLKKIISAAAVQNLRASRRLEEQEHCNG